MSKAYSNKALPPGTVLREWRLEEVLGVGGFGIVYKARGIYFNELVAIKEYFPSSISERDEEATVVPIDSDAEEVHALGLKKFVEEAKLLWNLSTPSRHPNIVSVRSLFEIHGTAYMVMDFEDGTSLSRLLKDGYRFNERSLWEMIAPISEGLDRAHRVGVLHRDIKPPNILITPEGRSVLIDFGSARFDTAEATSTQVTFHTPPYAAIEQYVKTYKQGPWTDIYALGVVLYECVTGAKPPEVLERLHGGQGQPLSAGKWPSYGKAFLAAIDTAMTIKPEERPQSIDEWLALFPESGAAKDVDPDEEERTRFTIHEVAVEEIVPVAPPVDPADLPLDTRVPESTEEARFKRAGGDTKAKRRVSQAPPTPPASPAGKLPAAAAISPARPEPAATVPKPEGKVVGSVVPPVRNKGVLVAAGIAGLLAVGAAGWALMSKSDPVASPFTAIVEPSPGVSAAGYSGPDTAILATNLKTLAEETRSAGLAETLLVPLEEASGKLASDQQRLEGLLGNPARAGEAAALQTQMNDAAVAADKAFAQALADDAALRRERLAGAAPWSEPGAGRNKIGATERSYLARLDSQAGAFAAAVEAVAASADGAQSSAAARDLLGKHRTLLATFAAVPASKAAPMEAEQRLATADVPRAERKVATMKATASASPSPTATAPTAPARTESGAQARVGELNAIIDDGRAMARQVMRADRGENGRLARGYDDYLKNLQRSARGVSSNGEADRLIGQAKQTRAYLVFLVKQTR